MQAAARKEPLGQVALILLPSLKLKTKSPRGKSYQQEVHEFLVQNFGGYTVASGNIAGYWDDDSGEQYGEHREYRIALPDEGRVLALESFVAGLAEELGEESIYLEIGKKAWLVHTSAAGQKAGAS